MKNELPLVSVVIPTFNSAKFLNDALLSVLQQTYENIEIIVIDDGSTDNTSDVLLGFHDKVDCIYQPNQGSAVARNKGIEKAKGKYIAFLDADDLWTPYKLELQVMALEGRGIKSLCFGIDEKVSEDFELLNIKSLPRQNIEILGEYSGKVLLAAITKSPFHINNLMVSRELIKQFNLRFNYQLKKGQDSSFIFAICAIGNVVYLNEVLSYYRDNSNSVTYSYDPINYRKLLLDEILQDYKSELVQQYNMTSKDIKQLYVEADAAHAYHLYLHKNYRAAFSICINLVIRTAPNYQNYKLLLQVIIKCILFKLRGLFSKIKPLF